MILRLRFGVHSEGVLPNTNGGMVELVDTADSKSAAARRGGSTPSTPTNERSSNR